MTNLRVFETPEKRLLVEVTSPHLQLDRILFVAASFDRNKFSHLNPAGVLSILFRKAPLQVAFLVVSSIPRSVAYEKFKLIGVLEETDSINILNHILDVMAFP